MTDTIKIGEPKARPTRPLRTLPAKLDIAACLAIVEHIDPDLTAAGIMASREQLDLSRIDRFGIHGVEHFRSHSLQACTRASRTPRSRKTDCLIMFNQKKAKRSESSPSKSKPIAGRERLHFFAEELAKAKTAVEDLERRAATLENIGIDAVAADQALQAFIAKDGGIEALRAHSAGETKPDDEVSKLIATAKSTAEATGPAKSALPAARDALERAKAEVVRLGEEKAQEIERVMTALADATAREYKAAFDRVVRLHDELIGFANASSNYMGEIALIVEELKVPRFNLPALACINEHDPFLRRRGDSFTVNEYTAKWTTVKERLEADVDADVSDLIGL
jgi:hypothetical protein